MFNDMLDTNFKCVSADKLMVEGRSKVSKKDLQNLSPDAVANMYYDAAGNAIISVTSFVHAMPLKKIEIHESWPETWWDAFKERWFPTWAKRSWPVRWRNISVDQTIYGPVCPHLHHPRGNSPHLNWMAT